MVNNDWFDSFSLRSGWLERLRGIHEQTRRLEPGGGGPPLAQLLEEAQKLARDILGEYPDPQERVEAQRLIREIEYSIWQVRTEYRRE
jgi:hypothetical protein